MGNRSYYTDVFLMLPLQGSSGSAHASGAAMSVIPLAGRTLYCPLKLRRRDPKVLGVRKLYEGGDISLFSFFLFLIGN